MEAVGCSIVCQDRQGRLSSSWFNVDCSSAQCADILAFGSSGLHNTYSWFSRFFFSFTHHYSWIETPPVISYDHIRIVNARLAFPKTLHNFSHFLILLKSGNQYRSKCMKNMCCCCVHVHFSAWKMKCYKTLGNIKNDMLCCETIYHVFECMTFYFFWYMVKLYFQSCVWTLFFSWYVILMSFNFFPPDFLWL